MTIVYIDTETTGLDPIIHEIWEIAYAVDDGPIESAFVPHNLVSADNEALRIGAYHKRCDRTGITIWHDTDTADALTDTTLCAANPAFDAAFLRARWGRAPWRYRLFDIEAYAMGALGYEIPQGLARIAADLTDKGHVIPTPDHTAAGDVATLRACHLALKEEYAR